MIKIDNIEVYNFESALRGMRNPLNSWERSDSYMAYKTNPLNEGVPSQESSNFFVIGPNDLGLAQKLIQAGAEHCKFLRQIFVSMDIDGPLYWWKEMDQYRIGCTTNSESTMHKLATTPITRDCFSFDKELENFDDDLKQYIDEEGSYLTYSETVIRNCEYLRQKYLETQDVRYWRALIQLLPSSWNQKRTWTANYAVLRNIYHQRKNHKLKEWHTFCNYIEKMPYAKELITL